MEEGEGTKRKQSSCEDTLRILMQDEKLMDIELRGNDGVSVPANRCVLAARSEVFYKMFFGGFSEAKRSQVDFAFSGKILKATVEYICTDGAGILKKTRKKAKKSNAGASPDADDESKQAEQIEILVSLAAAAEFFQLPGLASQATSTLRIWMETKAACALYVLQACRDAEPPATSDIGALALRTVETEMRSIITNPRVASLSYDVLMDLVGHDKLQATALDLFKMIELWTKATPLNSQVSSRERSARDLIKYIHLERIDPEQLSTTVAGSNIVSRDQLLEAYKKQALHAKQQFGVSFNSVNNLPGWEGTSSTVVSGGVKPSLKKLACSPFEDIGTYSWTLEIEDLSCRTPLLGATGRGSMGRELAFILDQSGKAHVYGTDGAKSLYEIDFEALKFKAGSTVSFTLKIIDQEHSGRRSCSLVASVDGGQICTIVESFQGSSFIPDVFV